MLYKGITFSYLQRKRKYDKIIKIIDKYKNMEEIIYHILAWIWVILIFSIIILREWEKIEKHEIERKLRKIKKREIKKYEEMKNIKL